jgi:hypothetical protein
MISNMTMCVSLSIIMTSLHVSFNALLKQICYYVQLDRLVNEFIVPLEKQISSEQEEKQVVEKETQKIVGQKRRARTSMSSSASKAEQMVAAGGKRRSKRVKVAPTRYFPVVEEESWTTSPRASSGVVTMHTALTDSPPLENSILETDETTMNGIATDETTMNDNEDTNIGSSRRVVAASKTFDERFKDLMAFKAEFGHCNGPRNKSRNHNEHLSLGRWCSDIRRSYKIIKLGGKPRWCKLSKSDIKRLENAGFEWIFSKKIPFDERLKDLMVFKAEFGHCNVPTAKSSNNKYLSLGCWCSEIRVSYKAIKEGRSPGYKLSKADSQRLENAGFEWTLKKTFDEHFKDLMAFKAEFGHCNVPTAKSSNNKYYSLGWWCSSMRQSYKAIKKGERPSCKLSKADIERLENAGFEWSYKTFDKRFKDLMAFKAEFDHCNAPDKQSRGNKHLYKHLSLGRWCSDIRRSYKAIKDGGKPTCKLSKAGIQRLEKAGFEWRLK